MILAPTLTLSAGSGAAIVRPTFSRDFAGEKTLNNGTGPAITFTRASDATYFDADGVLRFAPNNHIRNSQAGGSTNGVLGSGGVAPTNWQLTPNSNGVTTEIIGTGTEDGLAYIDMKLSGTPTASSGVQINFESGTQIVAANGQTWTNSAYVTLAGGATTNATIDTVVIGRTAAGAGVSGQQTTAAFTPTSSSLNTQRRTATITFNDATVERVQSRVTVAFTNGNPIDLTLRIAAPQLERGPEATAYNPTTGTAYFGPRFDHDPATGASRGLLIEESRTNSIRNSQAGGANVPTNAIPTNWGAATVNGLTRTVVAVGTVNGFSYVDFQYSGTTTAASVSSVVPEQAAGQIAATNNQTWTNSCYIAVVGGSISGLSQIRFALNQTDGTNSLGSISGSDIKGSLTSSLQRFSATATTSSASTTHVRPAIELTYGNAAAIDITLRIAAPQLEQGAFPTSYIPTTTAAATRAADSAVVTPISSFFNQTESTVYAEFTRQQASTGTTNGPWGLVRESSGFGTSRNYASLVSDSLGSKRLRLLSYDTTPAPIGDIHPATTYEYFTLLKTAAGLQADNAAVAHNGLINTSTSYQFNGTPERFFIGTNAQATVRQINGHIRKIAYWPKRLTNTLLEQLTT